ncbi:hypothetical protein LINPERPRIM_LOCUS29447 [Linum perenne]
MVPPWLSIRLIFRILICSNGLITIELGVLQPAVL